MASNAKSGCPGGLPGGFDNPDQPRIFAQLAQGTYYLAVGECASSAGPFKLNVQRMGIFSEYFNDEPLTGAGNVSGNVSGPVVNEDDKCGEISLGKSTAYWYPTCGGAPLEQVFSFRPNYAAYPFSPPDLAGTKVYTTSGLTGDVVSCDKTGFFYLPEIVEHGTRGIHEVVVVPSSTSWVAFNMYYKVLQ
jgi:hypothetical protein